MLKPGGPTLRNQKRTSKKGDEADFDFIPFFIARPSGKRPLPFGGHALGPNGELPGH